MIYDIFETTIAFLGALFSIILLVLIAFLLKEANIVLNSTFEEGTVKIDEDHTYICKPDERTKNILDKEEQLKKAKD